MTTSTNIRTGQRVTRTTPIRSSSRGERARAKAVGFSAFLIMLMLTIAVTFTAITLTRGGQGGPGDPDDPPVGGDNLNFMVPLGGTEFTLLKSFNNSELQFNQTHNRWQSHRAMSIAAPAGTEVLAAYDGTITAITSNTLYGTVVEITHRTGKITRYSSLTDLNVSLERPEVRRGDVIGRVGTTSRVEFTTTPHLRLEMRDANGVRVNPAYFIEFGDK